MSHNISEKLQEIEQINAALKTSKAEYEIKRASITDRDIKIYIEKVQQIAKMLSHVKEMTSVTFKHQSGYITIPVRCICSYTPEELYNMNIYMLDKYNSDSYKIDGYTAQIAKEIASEYAMYKQLFKDTHANVNCQYSNMCTDLKIYNEALLDIRLSTLARHKKDLLVLQANLCKYEAMLAHICKNMPPPEFNLLKADSILLYDKLFYLHKPSSLYPTMNIAYLYEARRACTTINNTAFRRSCFDDDYMKYIDALKLAMKHVEKLTQDIAVQAELLGDSQYKLKLNVLVAKAAAIQHDK
jgi:hypothetical protein